MPKRHNLTIHQGQNFSFTYAPGLGSLSGYSARMSIKTDLWADYTAYLSNGADADGGSISIGSTDVTITMTAAQTDALDELGLEFFARDRQPLERKIKFIYDLELVSGAGVVTKALWGDIIFYRAVTK